MKRKILTTLVWIPLVIAITTSLTACHRNKGKEIITDMEKCLGNAKTKKDIENLPKSQITDIAKCMLPKLEACKKETANMTTQEKEKFTQEFKDALEKSDYKEILSDVDYDKVKELAGESDDNAASNMLCTGSSNSTTTSPNTDADAPSAPPATAPPASESYSSESNNYDELLDSYEKNTDDYIQLIDNMSKDDVPDAMSSYADLVKSTADLSMKLENVHKSLTLAQVTRMIKIQAKLAKAMEKANAKMNK